MANAKVTIIDYGMGNLFSIERAIRYIGGYPEITDNPTKIASAERLILPGVGAYGKGMHELEKQSIIEAIYEFIKSERPLLGICLGMQFFLTQSNEFGIHAGLNLVKGNVARFKESISPKPLLKIPHVGWNSIEVPERVTLSKFNHTTLWNRTILKGVNPGSNFYFVHSFFCLVEDTKNILAESKYGEDRFCSVLNKNNIWGCQFHPERSAENGLKIYRSFMFNM